MSLISVPIGVYFGLIEARTGLGQSIAGKKDKLLQNTDWMLDQTHSLAHPVTLHTASGHSVFK